MSNYSGLDTRSIAQWQAQNDDPNYNPIPEPNGFKETAGSFVLFFFFIIFPLYLGWQFSKWIIRHSGGYLTGIIFFYYHFWALCYFWEAEDIRNYIIPNSHKLEIGPIFIFDPIFAVVDSFWDMMVYLISHSYLPKMISEFVIAHATFGKIYLAVTLILFVYTLVRWALKSPEKKEIISAKNEADKEKYHSVTRTLLLNPFIWFYLSYKLAAPSKS